MLKPLLIALICSSSAMAECQVTLVGVCQLPSSPGSVVLNGDYCYLGSSTGLAIVDIAEPGAPAYIGTYATADSVFDITVRGRVGYLGLGPSGLATVDLTDPVSPLLLGTLPTAFPCGRISLSGDYACLAARDLIIADVSDPSNPAALGSWLARSDVHDVVAVGTTAYVAEQWEGLGVVDFTNPSQPLLIGGENPQVEGDLIKVREHLAFVLDSGIHGLRIIDVSQSTNPVTIGVEPTVMASGVVLIGERLVTTAGCCLWVVDVSDPTNPQTVHSSVFSSGIAGRVAIRGGLAYIAFVNQELRIYDISDCLPPPCPADIDGDGKVDPFDSNACMARFGCDVNGNDPLCTACDIDGDGVVNPFDSNAVMAGFGDCP